MTTYEQYIGVIKQIETLEKMKGELRKDIESNLPEEGYKDETINVFWKTRKSYKYSPKIDELGIALKVAKKEEESDGTATFEETKQLTINVK